LAQELAGSVMHTCAEKEAVAPREFDGQMPLISIVRFCGVILCNG